MKELETSVLFQGLARPPMIMGVTLTFLVLNGLCHLIIFVATGAFWPCLSILVVHILGKLLCKYEPNIFNILAGFISHIKQKESQSKFGGNIYEAC